MAQTPKIALIRGRNLNAWEMQNFLPLQPEFSLTGFTSKKGLFQVDRLGFPVVRLGCLDDWADRIRGYHKILHQIAPNFPGREQVTSWTSAHRLVGLEEALTGFDLAHTAEVFTAYSQQAAQAKAQGRIKALVVTVWENLPYYTRINRFFQQGVEEVLQQADLFLAVSQRAAACLELWGADRSKIDLLPPGVDDQRFCPSLERAALRQRFQIQPDQFLVLSVARHDWTKGLQDLISALAWLKKKSPALAQRLRVKLIGQGKFRPFLQGLIQEHSLEAQVELVDFLPYDQIPVWYQAADLFVLPSTIAPGWQEQFGMVLAEAQSTGLACVGTHSGAIGEVLCPQAPLAQPSDFYSLALILENLLSQPQVLAELSQACLAFAQTNYRASLFSERLQMHYRRLLNLSQEPSP